MENQKHIDPETGQWLGPNGTWPIWKNIRVDGDVVDRIMAEQAARIAERAEEHANSSVNVGNISTGGESWPG